MSTWRTPRWASASITAFWIYPFLMKMGASLDKLVITSVINLNFCIFLSCFYNGGVLSPTLPWILIIPLLSFFYIAGEKKHQSTLLTIFGGSFSIFLFLYLWFAPAPNDIPEYAMTVLGIVSTIATLAYVATMAIYYSRIFDVGVELENEVRRRRYAAEELRLAMAETDRTGRMKSEFLARMSHELRTPLNAIIGYSEILREDALDANDHTMIKDVDKIHDAGQYLVRLIKMILDLSKIEAGHMQFDVKKHSLNQIVSNAVQGASEVITQNGNQMAIDRLEEDDEVEIDDDRLTQVLDSILRNAGDYTRDGHVRVSCYATGEGADRVYRVVIADNGCGIEDSRIPTLFDSLLDKRDASTGRYGGTGLNLSVSYRLAQIMGCDITVESAAGVGSIFTVTVPSVSKLNTVGAKDESREPAGMAALAA